MCDNKVTDSDTTGSAYHALQFECEAGETLWSDSITWTDLTVPVSVADGAAGLDLSKGWQDRWTVSWKASREEHSRTVRQVAEVPLARANPLRAFSWARAQRHRPGLQYMVSTGRHHGFESIEEMKALLVLDFAGDVIEVVSQPVRLRFEAADGEREHIPDFLAMTRAGTWLIDVRPEDRIKPEDQESFAAAAEAALACGWAYVLLARWRDHVMSAVDALSSQRRPLRDPLNLQPGLVELAGEGLTFGELAVSTPYEPVARAQLLHLLWRRHLGIDLSRPLGNASVVRVAAGVAR